MVSQQSTAIVRREAHRSSVEHTVPDITSSLVELLGAQLLAHALDVESTTVNRWKSGKVTPASDAEAALRSIFQIVELIRRVDSDHVVRAWFIGMNPQLDDRAPAELIRERDFRSAMAAASAFVAGG